MPLKCCVTGCRVGYAPTKAHRKETAAVYRFPSDPAKTQRWVQAIPRDNLEVNNNTVVCRRHWPPDAEFTTSQGGMERPVDPPSVFDCVPPSQVPTPPPPPRPTSRASSSARREEEEEMEVFRQDDAISCLRDLSDNLEEHRSDCVAIFPDRDSQTEESKSTTIQSRKYVEGVPLFLLKVYPTLRFQAFHLGSQVTVQTLSRNRITELSSWAAVDEAVRYLTQLETDHKKKVLMEQMKNQRVADIGEKLYSVDTILQSYEYLATSRVLYQRMRNDFSLPSVRTLQRLTSKVSKHDCASLISKVFSKLEERQRNCVIYVDEVYLKPSVQYHGGTIFGRAVNKPDELAQTMLAVMVQPMFGGTVFMPSMVPVKSLDADFQFETVKVVMDAIESSGGKVIAIVADGNKVNQNFFKKFGTVEGKPWLTTTGSYLLFDFVHLWKNIRNNWITEQTQEIQFMDQTEEMEEKQTAKWAVLRGLHQMESGHLLKLSKLNDRSVAPKPIERQNVGLMLRVFCDETVSALHNHPELDKQSAAETALYIQHWVKGFKVLNVKGKGEDLRFRDPRRAVIEGPTDPRLDYLLSLARMVEDMNPVNGRNRKKTLTKDTGTALCHTLKGLVDLARDLLQRPEWKYVIFGEFSTDRLEKAFSILWSTTFQSWKPPAQEKSLHRKC